MNIFAIAMVKNEQDIIEPFVRHNLKYVDRMYVLDHFSNDQTSVMLQQMRDEGLAVLPVTPNDQFRTGAYLQSDIMTQLFSTVHEREKHGGYLFLDADEFLDHPEGRSGLEQEFESIHHSEVIYVPWRTHVIPANADNSYFSDPPRSFTHRRVSENPSIFKAMLKVEQNRRLPKIEISFGNHNVFSHAGFITRSISRALGIKSYRVLRGAKGRELTIRHYPVRSSEQVFQKAVLGWLATLHKYPSAREKNICFQWREIFDEIISGATIDSRKLHEISLSYAQDGGDCDVVLDDSINYDYIRRYKVQTSPQITRVLQELERRAIARGQITNSFLNRLLTRLGGLRSRFMKKPFNL